MNDQLQPSTPHSSSRLDAMAASDGAGRGVVKVSAEMHQGALDAPHVLQAYNAISPDLLDRVVTLAEEQASHRRKLEHATVVSQLRRSWAGMASGFTIAVLGLGLGGYMAHLNHPWAATVFASINLVALVSTFVKAQKSE